ncbi:hypothetical protein PAMC26510_07120 [Caballeronia sordidicola]|uniref:Secreted protein n=1 Tax=Caballeronia sordidicola TaxID=196367 RepID=A0A242N4F9_CABSO|nr:hypothetical protein PAMC26510_07120 [Caballeronia sordidicola]
MTCAWACAFCLRFLLFNCVSCLPRRLSAYRLQPQAVPILDVQNWCAAFERALKRQNRHRPDRRGSVSGATSGRLQPSARLRPVPKRPVFYPKPLCPRGPARLKWARGGSGQIDYMHFQDGVVPAQTVVAERVRPYILSIATSQGVRNV